MVLTSAVTLPACILFQSPGQSSFPMLSRASVPALNDLGTVVPVLKYGFPPPWVWLLLLS